MNQFLLILCTALLLAACQGQEKIVEVQDTIRTLPVLEIKDGLLQGEYSSVDPQVAVYKGIPYAAPPVSSLRWRAPEAAVPWKGIRDASKYGDACWQPPGIEKSVYYKGLSNLSEDCLSLNVWSSANQGEEALAVMVWFHGGSNVAGSGSSTLFDGSHLAKKGVVVVTVNYRLGPLGFFAHPGLSLETAHRTSGNYGLMDQISALRWVQKNIDSFGGDPSRVTIFGQSAGSTDVCLLMASPLASGLFHRAMMFSSGCMRIDTPLTGELGGESQGEKVATILGVKESPKYAIEKLRGFSPEDLYTAAVEAAVPLAKPIVDGRVIPEPPRQLFSAGHFNRVPVVTGHMADEMLGLRYGAAELSESSLKAQLQKMFGSNSKILLNAYKDTASQSPDKTFNEISTDAYFGWESRKLADYVSATGVKAFVYHFSYPTTVFKLYGKWAYQSKEYEFPVAGGDRALGAYHSGDLPYMFNNTKVVGLAWTERDHLLADTISSYWVNFAKFGDPNGLDLVAWPSWDKTTDKVIEFGADVKAVKNPRHSKLNIFDMVFNTN